VEIALWDILGKAGNHPIYHLLGGAGRESVWVYLDGFFRGASYVPDEYAQKAIDAIDAGFTTR
jgi:L-alanine-DL-glutamate epimerase-like enolase superfamily enzyme